MTRNIEPYDTKFKIFFLFLYGSRLVGGGNHMWERLEGFFDGRSWVWLQRMFGCFWFIN